MALTRGRSPQGFVQVELMRSGKHSTARDFKIMKIDKLEDSDGEAASKGKPSAKKKRKSDSVKSPRQPKNKPRAEKENNGY